MIHFKNQLHSRKYRKLILEDKIVFSNFNGLGYGCNPKYIAEEIIRRNYKWDMVWLVNNKEYSLPSQIRKVEFNSLESCRELSTAKVIINNVKGELNFKKRKGQIYIETWHAGFSIKKLEKAAKKMLPKDYIAESKNNSLITDYMLSNSEEQTKEYRENFWYKGEILEFGLPRNDPYFNKNNDVFKSSLKEKIGIDKNAFVIIYAPTFRTNSDTLESYGLDFRRLLKTAEQKLKRECILLLKTHPNIRYSDDLTTNNAKIKNLIAYPDMQELLIISDLLITDYSSTMFEFALLEKPTIIFAADAEQYNNKIRGLKEIFWQSTFPLSRTNDQLQWIIENFDFDKAKQLTLKIKEKYCTYDKGDASKKVVDFLVEKLDNGIE